MVKAVLKSHPAKKEAVVAMSKKSKPLEKKATKKKPAVQSPEAKKFSLILKNGRHGKTAKKNEAEPAVQSPETEIKFKPKVLVKPKGKKSGRFDKMKKIHKDIKEKKLKARMEKDEDSDESADEDDACKSYVEDIGLGEEEPMDDSEGESGEEEVAKKESNGTKPKKGKGAHAEKVDNSEGEEDAESEKDEDANSENEEREGFVDKNDPAERARTVLITNVSMKVSRGQIASLMSTYGKIISVRLRNMPVLKKNTSSGAVKMQVIKKRFKKGSATCTAYVKFELPEQAEAALSANTSVLDGFHIFVVPVLSTADMKKHRALTAGSEVVVGNLPYETEAEPLYQLFSTCGEVSCVSIVRNKRGSCSGIAFVLFKDKASVPAALDKQGTTLKGRDIRVSKSVKKSKKNVRPGAEGKDSSDQKPGNQNNNRKKFNKNNGSPHRKLNYRARLNKDAQKKLSIASKLAATKSSVSTEKKN